MIDEFRNRIEQIKESKSLMRKKEIEVNYELQEANEIQSTCDKELRLQVPKFIAANEGLKKITRKQLEEICTIRSPSKVMLTLSKAVCIIMKVPPTEIKTKETNFKSTFSYWVAFQGP